ncbi:ABC transporter permease [Xanthovirga aplysinae]|uniref:ABC transporter permease n=1 Tax=Xanthovirga aplysinae TaxID=2529853 RepID=UPI0012BD34EE|nr:ABC transporter permease [Xanthovirga aplysinae]MTI32854.1 FtsX-like permease family protein [Xanthovirga aplysinae]
MLKNYFKTALRNLLKHKFYSLINVLGLAVGMACCMLIFFWVQDELSYDTFHTKADRIFRVATEDLSLGKGFKAVETPGPLAKTLKSDYPEVEESVSIWNEGETLTTYQENSFNIERTIYAEPSLFDVFSIPLIKGNSFSALTNPHSIVLSQSTAQKIFGKENPIGKMLIIDQENYQVSGVFEDLPENSHFHADLLLSMTKFREQNEKQWIDSWDNLNFITYILLAEGSNPASLEERFPKLIKSYMGPEIKVKYGRSLETYFSEGNKRQYFLQKLTDIHLHSNLWGEFEANGNITYVYVFTTIAFFILLIAAINYMNLATARSAERAKEVGVRKVLGALRLHLIRQFLSESILLSGFAIIMALMLVEISLPAFNQLTGKTLTTSYIQNWHIMLSIITILLTVGILSGSYPAFFLSSFSPTKVLKGEQTAGVKSGKLRSVLVVLQFGITIVLMVSTVVIYKQLQFIQNTDPGFKREQVVILNDTNSLGKQRNSFKQEILAYPMFNSSTITGFLPVKPSNRNNAPYYPKTWIENENFFNAQSWNVDKDYLTTMGMKMKQGRFFSSDFPSDSSAVVINEEAAQLLGFDHPIGKTINNGSFTIIGVIKNFNFESLRENIGPLVLHLDTGVGSAYWRNKISFRIKGEDINEALNLLQKKWQEFAPGQAFSYSFMDDQFQSMYHREQRIGKTLALFAVLAIFIACLGLLGLAGFTTEKRRKEIGIRKVLGASISGIIFLLSKEIARLILIAFLLASPLAWWFMDGWLQNFQYRTPFGMDVFVIAGAITFLIAWLAMSYHAIQAATDDPVNSIRYE